MTTLKQEVKRGLYETIIELLEGSIEQPHEEQQSHVNTHHLQGFCYVSSGSEREFPLGIMSEIISSVHAEQEVSVRGFLGYLPCPRTVPNAVYKAFSYYHFIHPSSLLYWYKQIHA
jgi:hypothetical protein